MKSLEGQGHNQRHQRFLNPREDFPEQYVLVVLCSRNKQFFGCITIVEAISDCRQLIGASKGHDTLLRTRSEQIVSRIKSSVSRGKILNQIGRADIKCKIGSEKPFPYCL
ncbi:MAG: hypothetical protein AO396_01400 [Candidatus Fermentibacter daniensis]|nr:MAG: hypothetical protein AO396_01400 [Candidatus Fermentibacter daniensis]